MAGRRTSLVATCLSMVILLTGTAQALEIIQFDKMAIKDQSEYIVVLIEGAQKVSIAEGKDDLAAQIHKLFTEVHAGDTIPLGMIAFEENLDRARLVDAERHAKDHNVRRLEVEDVMIVTLKRNDIILPLSFMHVADNFRPKFPPDKN